MKNATNNKSVKTSKQNGITIDVVRSYTGNCGTKGFGYHGEKLVMFSCETRGAGQKFNNIEEISFSDSARWLEKMNSVEREVGLEPNIYDHGYERWLRDIALSLTN